MNLPKKLEEKCVNNSAKYVDFDILYHEKHNKEKSGAKEASIYREGFKDACELLLPEIEKMRICLEHYANEELWFEATCLGGPDIAKETLKQWQEFAEGE